LGGAPATGRGTLRRGDDRAVLVEWITAADVDTDSDGSASHSDGSASDSDGSASDSDGNCHAATWHTDSDI
jgi:hypothetical protein